MIKGKVLGGFKADWRISHYAIPKNIEDDMIQFDTVFNRHENKGTTYKLVIPTKSFWDLGDHVKLKDHKTKEDAEKYHEKVVKEEMGWK